MSHVLFVQALYTPTSKQKAERTAQIHKSRPLLACLPRPPYALTAVYRADKAGRGALELPLEDGARTNRFFIEKFEARESHAEAGTKTNSSLTPLPTNLYIIFMYIRRANGVISNQTTARGSLFAGSPIKMFSVGSAIHGIC